MGLRHRARLALDAVAERDALVAGSMHSGLRSAQAVSRPRRQRELTAGENRIAGLGRFIPGIVERSGHGTGQRELEFRNDGARIGQRARIGHGRPRADRRRIVARHVRDRDGDKLRRMCVARQPAAFDAREMFAHRIDLADIGAGTQQRARHRLFVGEGNAGRRRDPVGRGAARHQHQHQIVGGRAVGELECALGGFETGGVGDRMPGLNHVHDLGRPAVAVAGDGDTAEPFGRKC